MTRYPGIVLTIMLLICLVNGQAWASSDPRSRTVVDMAGRHVRIPREIQRVVTAGGTPAINAFIATLGRAGLIVNGLPQQMRGDRWKYQRLFIPSADGPVVSGMGPAWAPDLEALRALPHDLVLVDNEQTARMLERRGFTVICLLWRGPDSVRESMRLMGDLLNRREQALEYERYYSANLELVRRAVAGVPPGRRPRALFCRIENMSLPMVSTARILVERSGGVNASKGDILADHAAISLETLLLWNPDVLFVWSLDDVHRAYSDQRFAPLKAVRERRVFVVPTVLHAWTNFTPEQALAILWMAKKLYPARLEEISPEKETRAFYRRFCGKVLTTQQIKEILRGEQLGGQATSLTGQHVGGKRNNTQ
jgi:iron complex transport system substrate-binding protein